MMALVRLLLILLVGVVCARGELRARPPLTLFSKPLIVVGEFVDGVYGPVTQTPYWASFRIIDVPGGSVRDRDFRVVLPRERSRVEWMPPKVAILVVDGCFAFGHNAPRSIIPYDPEKLAEILRRAHSPEELANYLRTDPELPPEKAFALAIDFMRTLPYAENYLPARMEQPVLLPQGKHWIVVLDPRPLAESALVVRDVFGWRINFFTLPGDPVPDAVSILVLDSGEIAYHPNNLW